MPKSKWTHPIHARGVRSPRLDVRGGKLLTDKQITKYAKLGYYGTEAQAAALSKDKKKKKRKASPQTQALLALRKLLGISS
jgi:hypothetical protein